MKVESDDPKIRGMHLATQMESSIRAFYDHFMHTFDKNKISDLWIRTVVTEFDPNETKF